MRGPPLVAALLGGLTPAGAAGVCRFGPSYFWDLLPTDSVVQDAYARDVLTWDGKFAAAGLGLSAHGLTCDHEDLREDGAPVKKATCGASYTAASKESLHVEMLAKVVDRDALAWHWMAGAGDQAEAVSMAVGRLQEIIEAYEAFADKYPGLGGFLPWLTVTDAGLILDRGKPEANIMLPALDNGQLAWALIAAAAALEAHGEGALAQRYTHFVEQRMAPAVNALFLRPDGKPGTTARVKDPRAPVSVGNRELSGRSSFPFEGELMVVFMDLYGTWADPGKRETLWLDIRFYTRRTKELSDPMIPGGGKITVQEGWRFSAHEMWKYMILPYFDNPQAKKVFVNGERARTWSSHLKKLPGLLASTYDAHRKYFDTFGIESLSKGYPEPPQSSLMVTPYGAYPVILANRGYGLAWHQAMVSRPFMQSELGSVESGEALVEPPHVARMTSWDTKVTTDLAIVGGVSDLLRRSLKQSGKYERFLWILNFNYNAWSRIALHGEGAGFAPPPLVPAGSLGEDFPTCKRLALKQSATTRRLIAGFTVQGVDYSCVDKDEVLKDRLRDAIRDGLLGRFRGWSADAANISRADVRVDVFPGSVRVEAFIAAPAAAAAAVLRKAHARGSSAQLAAALVSQIQGLPGLAAASSGEISISGGVAVDAWTAEAARPAPSPAPERAEGAASSAAPAGVGTWLVAGLAALLAVGPVVLLAAIKDLRRRLAALRARRRRPPRKAAELCLEECASTVDELLADELLAIRPSLHGLHDDVGEEREAAP